jgi:hypothetical protein
MFCCDTVRTRRKPKNEWIFSNGSHVIAESIDEAIEIIRDVSSNSFWASETEEGKWDVQLKPTVTHYNVPAQTVTQAVNYAVWKSYLDFSMKNLNVHESPESKT